jgi:hypothetical protein
MRFAILLLALSGCVEAKQAAAERAYREEQEACLRQYETKNDQRACVNKVRAKWASDAGDE